MVAPPALPLTLLSGFLGAGKTTLLKRILNNKEGLKCAVIVNDLASVNVDAHHQHLGKDCTDENHLVHMENGCVCCDLNEEFLKHVVDLAQTGNFDYIIVENTGVAEPEPVAESVRNIYIKDKQDQENPIEIVKLDTCVTVVDASMFFKHLYNGKRLNETDLVEKADTDEGEEMICQLMARQIEYADVVALNKTDLLDADKLKDVSEAIRLLHPKAKVITCSYGEIDWRLLLGTGMFSTETTAVKEITAGGEHDESFEDAVTSYVYTGRMPFHPERLHKFINTHFNLHERDWSCEMKQNESDALSTVRHAGKAIASAAKTLSRLPAVRAAANVASEAALAAAAIAEGVQAAGEDGGACEAARSNIETKRSAGGKKASKKSPLGRILRSKGFVWLAGSARNSHCADWSLAGDVLQFTTGGPWMCELPVSLWPSDEDKRKEVLADFSAGVCDRRQELVFIGMDLNTEAIREALDGCLCTHLELLENGGQFTDPFAPWPTIEEMLPASDDEEESDEEGEEDGDEEAEQEGAEAEMEGDEDEDEDAVVHIDLLGLFEGKKGKKGKGGVKVAGKGGGAAAANGSSVGKVWS